MKSWLKRLGYLVVIMIWLIVMAFPITAFVVSTRGQLQIGQNPSRQLRIFMVQETDANGVGVQWTRKPFGEPNCAKTTLRYVMWDGEAEPASFCQCFDLTSGETLPSGDRCSG